MLLAKYGLCIQKIVFVIHFKKCPKMSGSLFSVQKIDRHKNIYKNLKNFLHHALNRATTHFLKKKSMEFLKMDIFEMSNLQI